MLNKINILLFIFLTGCSDIFGPEITCIDSNTCDLELDLHMNYELDENGYYHFQMTNEFYEDTYGQVQVISNPMERVYWASPDSFIVFHMGYPIIEPIIQHSIYTNDDGEGNQFFWIDLDAIGDTLTIYGSINSLIQSCEWYDGPNDCEYTQEELVEKINVIIE